MTAKTDLTAQIATLNRVLAEATKECPEMKLDFSPDEIHPSGCICQGTGRVARFPGFRLTPCHFCGGDTTSPCEDCDDKRYLVRAGGLEDAEAGLTVEQFCKVESMRFGWAASFEWLDPMPSADVILAKSLELVCEIAGLEVPDGS